MKPLTIVPVSLCTPACLGLDTLPAVCDQPVSYRKRHNCLHQ